MNANITPEMCNRTARALAQIESIVERLGNVDGPLMTSLAKYADELEAARTILARVDSEEAAS